MCVINADLDLTNLDKPDKLSGGSGSSINISSYEDLRRLIRKTQAKYKPLEKKLFACWKKTKPNSRERDFLLKYISNFENRRWRTWDGDDLKLDSIKKRGRF